MKKCGYLFLAACLLTANISYAKTYTVFDENNIAVTDTTEPNSKVTYVVLKDGKTEADYDGSNALDIYVAYDEVKADSEGKYDISFKTELSSGVFSLATHLEKEEKRNDIIYYVKKSENEAQRTLLDTADDVADFLLTNKYCLGMEPELITEDTAKLTEMLYEKENFIAAESDYQTTKQILDKCAAIASLSMDKINLRSDYITCFDIDVELAKWINAEYMDDKVLEDYLSKDYKSLAEFETDLICATVLATVSKADGYGYVRDIMKQYKDILDIDNKYIKDDIVRKIVGKDFDNIEFMKDELINIYKDLKEPSKSSGGGGGGGGKVSSITAPPVATEKTEVVQPAAPAGFEDLAGYSWAEEAINGLKNLSIINGKTNTSFAPADVVTREEFVTIAMKTANFSDLYGDVNFSDVKETDWYYNSVKNAYLCGVISGISEDAFGSGMPVTRQDMAVILYNVLIKKGVSFENVVTRDFADAEDISGYAKKAVDVLASMGIINGDANGCFNPKANATRAEAAKMVYGILPYIVR